MSTATEVVTGTWVADKVHSSARYEIDHQGSVYRGSFQDVDGRLEYGPDGVKLTGVVKLESNDLKDEQQRGHVLSPDFFDAERYPEATFESTDVKLDGTNVEITGGLTLRGQTREVVVSGRLGEPGPNIAGTETLPITLEVTINRLDWGVAWNADLPNGTTVLGNDVKLEVALELVRG